MTNSMLNAYIYSTSDVNERLFLGHPVQTGDRMKETKKTLKELAKALGDGEKSQKTVETGGVVKDEAKVAEREHGQ